MDSDSYHTIPDVALRLLSLACRKSLVRFTSISNEMITKVLLAMVEDEARRTVGLSLSTATLRASQTHYLLYTL